MEDAKTCPRCGSDEVIPIVYGLPGERLIELVMAGKAKLGGCCVAKGMPVMRCKRCGYEWGEHPGHSRTRGAGS